MTVRVRKRLRLRRILRLMYPFTTRNVYLTRMAVFLLSALLLSGLVAGMLIFGVRVVRKSIERLPPADARHASDQSPTVSVIIPARNEQARIPALLDSLTTQSLMPIEIVVVDDESTDQTAKVAKEYGARVVKTPPRPAGWVGKTWACHTGASDASGDLLLFLDADVEMNSTALEQLVVAHRSSGGAVSVQPYHRTIRAYESFSALFNAQVVTAVGVGPSSRGLFGPCIMIEKSAYYRSGGHESVRSSVLDDVDLGRRCLAHGVSIRNYLGGEAVSFRMYPDGARDLFNGWTKNFLQGADATPSRVLLLQSIWIIGAVTVAVQAGFALAQSSFALLGVFPALSIYAAYAALLALGVRTYGSFGVGVALTFPLHLLFFGSIMVRALWLRVTGGSVEWRGRAVHLYPHGVPKPQKSARI